MRKKILSMSIAAVMTAVTSTGVMAFDTNDLDESIRAPEVTDSFEAILVNRLKDDIPNLDPEEKGITKEEKEAREKRLSDKISEIKKLQKLAGYQGGFLPQINGTAENTVNLHPPMQSVANLTVSPNNNLGDALIFPMFRQGDDWGTEIVVRNTDQEHAIVAKVAVYAADKSEEILDFNVYLSAADVVRFTIKDNLITSSDGSVLRTVPTPSSNVDDISLSNWASEENKFKHKLESQNGYVVVYGMAQASNGIDNFDRFDMRYHHKHSDLFKNYRRELDVCRLGWRNGHQNTMVNGTYTRHTRASQSLENYSVAAPNQGVNCNLSSNATLATPINATIWVATNAARLASQITDKASAALALLEVQNMLTQVQALAAAVNNKEVDNAEKMLEVSEAAIQKAIALVQPADQASQKELDEIASSINNIAEQVALAAASAASLATDPAPGNFFGDVDASLTGTVRLYNNATNGERDMILPATAIENFTSGNKIIYTDGEASSLADRKIQGTNDSYDSNTQDSEKYIAWAKYNEAGIRADANAFLVSKVSYNFAAKSVANQLVITQPYKRVLVQLGNDDGYWQDVNLPDDFGGFSFIYNVFDEAENMDNITYTESPHNSGLTIFRNELQKLENFEDGTQFKGQNGFALLRFTNINGYDSGIPAIVTQMIGTLVGESSPKPQVNWIYSQTK